MKTNYKLRIYFFVFFIAYCLLLLPMGFHLFVTAAFSQRNNFQTYSLGQGLPQATVYCIIQDDRGYLWLGTDGGGLCCFDGNNFKIYGKKDGFKGQVIRSLIQDSKGRIWVGTKDEGIIIYDGLKFISVGKKEGLAGTTILCMMEDETGTVWAGTDDGGLNKISPSPLTLPQLGANPTASHIEGKNKNSATENIPPFKVEVIDESKGLSNNSVMDIHKDKGGHIWLATFGGGINILTSVRTHDLSPNSAVSHRTVREGEKQQQVLRNGESRATGTGVAADTFHIDILRGGKEIPADQILSVAEENNGTLWFGTLEKGVFSLTPVKEKVSENFKSDILSRKITVFNQSNGFSAKTIWKIFNASENTLWLASTEDGVFRYSKQNFFERFTAQEGMPTNQIRCIFEDNEKNIWIGTDGGGLCKFMGDVFSHYSEKDGLPGNNVHCIDIDSSGTLWLGTNGGLVQMNFKNGEPICRNYSAKDGLSGNTVLSVSAPFPCGLLRAEDARKTGLYNQNIWAAVSNTGIAKYDGKKIFNYSEADGLLDNSVYSIFTDKNGIVWIGSKQGISRYDGKKFLSITMEYMKIGSKDVTVIIQDKSGNLWFGTGGGLAKYSGEKTITTYDETEGLMHKEILSLAEDIFGNLWIGTKNGGLYRFDVFTDDKIKIRLAANDSLLGSNSIRSIIFLDEKNKKNEGKEMIVGTDRGFNKITFDDRGKILKVRNYNASDGFTGVECNDNAICRDAKGNVWIGTVKGLTRFNPSAEIQNPKPPLIHITGVKLFFKDVNWMARGDSVKPWFNLPQSLELSYSENHLTFQYAAISLDNPEKIKYRYILEGVDKEWSPDRKETSATFSGLSPGTYIFKIIACGANGIWNTEPAAFKFTINPPWYRTVAAYIMYLILLAGGIYFYVKHRERELLLEKKNLEEKVQERTAEVVKQKDEIEKQKELIEEKNKDITDSINYAQRIQHAILPDIKKIKKAFPESFIFFRPRDIVSGDFYFFAHPQLLPSGGASSLPNGEGQGGASSLPNGEGQGGACIFIAAADCTGHGVPGAFMSMICSSLLNEAVNEKKILHPGEILNEVRRGIINSLKQTGASGEQKDGMDAALVKCKMEEPMSTRWHVEYAGANNSLYLIRKNSLSPSADGAEGEGLLEEIDPDNMPVGISDRTADFKNNILELKKGDAFYIFTDGYCDQFGGPKGKKFKYAQFKQLLLSIYKKPMEEQKTLLEKALDEWKGTQDQVDDILIIGVRI